MNTLQCKVNTPPGGHQSESALTLFGGAVIEPSKPREITDANKAFAPPNANFANISHAQINKPKPHKEKSINTTAESDKDQNIANASSSLAFPESIEATTVNPIPISLSALPSSVQERKQGNGTKSSPTSTTAPIITQIPSYYSTLPDEENEDEETLDSERRRRRQEFSNKRRRHTKATSLQSHYDDILSQVDAAFQNQDNNNVTERTSTRNLPTSVERHYLSVGVDLLAELEDEEEISDDENDENN